MSRRHRNRTPPEGAQFEDDMEQGPGASRTPMGDIQNFPTINNTASLGDDLQNAAILSGSGSSASSVAYSAEGAIQLHVQDSNIKSLVIAQHVTLKSDVQHTTSIPPAFPKKEPSLNDSCAKGFVKELKDAVNLLHDNEVKESIAGNFGNLKNPEKTVFPQMIEANYFVGDTAAKEGQLEADPTYITNDYSSIKGSKVELDELHKNCRYTAVVAQAGAGKTTLAKRYSSAAKAKKISSLRGIEMVRFIPLAKIRNTPGTPMEVLFHRLLPNNISEDAKTYGELWVKKNSNKILFVFDGLDQVDFTIEKCPKIQFTDSATPSEILYNLLHENLLPGCKILLTSREFAVRHLSQDTRPEKIITLRGLAEKDMKTLIAELAPSKAEAIIETIFRKSPALRSLGANPMFLIFTTAILEKNSENATPDSLSGVLMRLLKHFLQSENQRVENIRDICEKLSSLALDGMMKRKFVFYEDDMVCYCLDAKLVQDLVIITPEAGTQLCYKLIEGCFCMFFCHQSVQEALAAVKIKGKRDDDFVQFVADELCKGQWEVVLRNLLGIIFNRKTASDARVLARSLQDDTEKRKFLTGWLIKIIQKTQSDDSSRNKKRMRLSDGIPIFKIEDLCALLHECGDDVKDIIGDEIRKIVIASRQLRIDQMYAVLWVLSHCQPGVEVNLCSGYSDCLKDVLNKALKKCRNAKIDFRNRLSLLLKEQKPFSINQTTPMDQNKLKNTISSIELTITGLYDDSYEILSGSVEDAFVEKVIINHDSNFVILDSQLNKLFQVENAKVDEMTISRKMLAQMSQTSPSTFESLGKLAEQWQIKRLSLLKVFLNDEERSSITKGSGDHKVDVFDCKSS